MFKVILKLPSSLEEAEVSFFGEALNDISMAHSALRENNDTYGTWIVEWFVEGKPDLANVRARLLVVSAVNGFDIEDFELEVEELPDIDWLAHSYQQFPPFSVGSFFIYGSHFDGEVPEGLTGLQIDAATAFGSGEHATTKGCLEAMLELKAAGQCPWNVLDMGTGSGILAVAAWKLWKTPILAVDNDAEAVRVADVHRDLNSVPSGKTEMSCACGDGFKTHEVQDKKPYDLIIANILAGPLMEMAEDLKACLDENGYVVLSGILNTQAEDVIDVYVAQGLSLKKHKEIGEWTTLVLKG